MELIYDSEIPESELTDISKELALKVIEEALSFTGCPFEAQVSLTITGDEAIREMNRDYRGIDAATDVLSFPMIDFPIPGDFSFLEQEGIADGSCFDPDSGALTLGDIVISADHVNAQAAEYGHSRKREFAFLVAHSMLHLMGYDHMQPDEAKEMEKMQEQILENLGIRRDA